MADEAEVRRSVTAMSPDGVEYQVLAAKRGVPFRRETLGGSGIVDMLILSVIGAVLEVRASGRSAWKVGILRVGRLPQRIVHKEVLSAGVDPGERMSELAARITAGHDL